MDYLQRIKSLPAVDRVAHWVTERELVRYNRAQGKSPPWTDDPIISTYRFCNVRRMDDRVSLWLLNNWYQPYYNHPLMPAAATLARSLNLPATLEHLTKEVFRYKTKIKFDKLFELIDKHRQAGNRVFNGAYIINGGRGGDKVKTVLNTANDVITWELHKTIPRKTAHSMQRTHELLTSISGLGSFMAGQVVADLRWAMQGEWNDRLLWAPKGPGSQRGLNRFFGRELNRQWGMASFLEYLCSMRNSVSTCLVQNAPCTVLDTVMQLELHDWQNIMCEFDKYERTLFDNRKPKQKYKPTAN